MKNDARITGTNLTWEQLEALEEQISNIIEEFQGSICRAEQIDDELLESLYTVGGLLCDLANIQEHKL